MNEQSTKKLAIVAFLLHAPGLKWVCGFRLSPTMFAVNLVAAGATLIASVLALLFARPASGLWPPVVAFAIGHFAWSFILTGYVIRRSRA